MGIWEWLAQNWFDFFSVMGIVAGLWFTAISLRSESRMRRVSNLLAITANHREIWKEVFQNSELTRVLDATADLVKRPVSREEKVFVNLVLLHSSSVFYAMKDGLVVNLEGLRRDVSEFVSLPIPQVIWENGKALQNEDFVAFVESCLKLK